MREFLVHSLYFLVIDNSLPKTFSQAGLSYQTCIKLSSRDVPPNPASTLEKVFSKNYRRTSKKIARIRTAKEKRRERKKAQGSQTLLFSGSLIAKPNPVNYKIAFIWTCDGAFTYCWLKYVKLSISLGNKDLSFTLAQY